MMDPFLDDPQHYQRNHAGQEMGFHMFRCPYKKRSGIQIPRSAIRISGKDSIAMGIPLSFIKSPICTIGSFRSSLQTPIFLSPFSKTFPSSSRMYRFTTMNFNYADVVDVLSKGPNPRGQQRKVYKTLVSHRHKNHLKHLQEILEGKEEIFRRSK